MTTLSITEARERLAEAANRVSFGHERIVVERHGQKLFALVPVDDLELLERLDDAADLAAVKAVAREKAIPWAEAKRSLGL